MRPTTKIKKEYTAEDAKFPLDSEMAMSLIQKHGKDIQTVASEAGLNKQTVKNWIEHNNFATRKNVLRVFGPLGIDSGNLISLVITHPDDEVLGKIKEGIQRKRDERSSASTNDSVEYSTINGNIDELADQVINLTKAVNQMSQNQKVFFTNWKQLFEQLSKYSDEQAKQQNYLVSEIKSLRKEVQQKNVLIRELQR